MFQSSSMSSGWSSSISFSSTFLGRKIGVASDALSESRKYVRQELDARLVHERTVPPPCVLLPPQKGDKPAKTSKLRKRFI
jgi:hypothetical protein